MDSKRFKSYLNKNFTPVFSDAGFGIKESNFIKIENEELLKGFAFEKSNDNLYVTWFLLPFVPVAEDLSLDVGERITSSHETGDLFILEDEKNQQTTVELKHLISEQIKLLHSIQNLKDYYEYFYVQNNWDRLNNRWLKSDLRNLERIIFAKAYLDITFEKELNKFRKKWESDDRNQVNWMQNMKNQMDALAKAKKENREAVVNLLESMKRQTIENLNLHKYL